MMDTKDLQKLKMHLTEAQACVDRLMGGADDEGDDMPARSAAPEGDDGDMASKSLAMKFGKYK